MNPAVPGLSVKRRLTALSLFFLALVLLSRAAAGQEAPAPYPRPGGGYFTIGRIEPALPDRTVAVSFTDAVDLDSLEAHLRIVPPVRIDWKNSVLTDPQRLVLKADWRPGTRYSLLLPTGFQSWNARLYVHGTGSFMMPEYQAGITPVHDGSLIERDSRQLFPVSVAQVKELDVRLLQVPPIMLTRALDAAAFGPRRSWAAVEREMRDSAKELAEGVRKGDFKRFFGPVTEEHTMMTVTDVSPVPRPLSVPLSFRKDRTSGGIFLVNISARSRGGEGMPLRIVAITDIGLSYKVSGRGMLIWATSLRTGKPLDEVRILAFTAGAEAVVLGETDERGLLFVGENAALDRASLPGPGTFIRKGLSVSEVRALAAVRDEDQSFIEVLPDTSLATPGVIRALSDERTGAQPKALVFTDRGLYLPGDTVNIKGVLREYRNGAIAPPKSGAVRFRVIGPDGAEAYRREAALSDFGTAFDGFSPGTIPEPGRYEVALDYGPMLSEKVSTFVEIARPAPQRHVIEVSCRPGRTGDSGYVNVDVKTGALECDVAGRYADGGPLKRARMTWTSRYHASEHRRNDYPGYVFGHPPDRNDIIASGETVLDERGRTILTFGVGDAVLSGTYAAEVTVSVEDIDGTPASGSAVFQAEPEYLVGVFGGPPQALPGEHRTLNVLVINRKGKKLGSGTLNVRVMQKTVPHGERVVPGEVAPQAWRTLVASQIPFKRGEAAFGYDVPPGGDSLVSFTYRARDGREYASGAVVALSEGHGGAYAYTDAVALSDVLHLHPDKTLYRPGDIMKFRLGASRPLSTCLVTVEQDGVLDYGVVELKPGQEMIDLPVKDGYGPNVYVSVLGTTARTTFPATEFEVDAAGPGHLFGTTGIEVKDERARLVLSVNDDEKRVAIRPGSEMTLSVFVRDEDGEARAAEVTVAVVREDLLAATRFSVPSLARLGRPLMPLGVFTGEARGRLIRQSAGRPASVLPPLSWSGSGAAGPAALSASFEDTPPGVVYYNAALRTNASGKASATFALPDASSAYRVYAVACDKGSRFGAWEGTIETIKSLSLKAELPPAVTKGDRFRFSLDARNGTGKTSRLGIHLPPDGLIAFSTEDKKHVIGPSEGLRITAMGRVQKAGVETVRLSGTLDGSTDALEQPLTVRSRDVMQQTVLTGSFRREGTASIALPSAWRERPDGRPAPDEVTAALTITGSPYLRLSQAVRGLLDDPPGTTVPLGTAVMAVASLLPEIRNGLVPDVTAQETETFVTQGRDRLLARQTASGGFALLQGEDRPHRWATVAAFGALTVARKAGIEVAKEPMAKAVSFMQAVTAANRDEDRLVNGYGLYFLSLNGYLDRAVFEGYAQRLESLPSESAVMVLAAGRSSKLMPEDRLRTRLRPLLDDGGTAPAASEDADFRLRSACAALIAASLALPRDEAAEMLAGGLLSSMDPGGAWPSLIGTGWAVYALQEYYRAVRADIRPATVLVRHGERILDTFLLDPKTSRTFELDAAEFMSNPSFSLSSGIEAPLLYRISTAWPRLGSRLQGFGSGIEVQKTVRNVDGSDRVRPGDIVEVRIRFVLNVPLPRAVLIEDRVPAGLVPMAGAMKTDQNPMQGQIGQAGAGNVEDGPFFSDDEQIPAFWYELYREPAGHFRFAPDVVEARGDLVRVFRNAAWSGIYEYSYYARAAFEGEFSVPAAKVRLAEDGNVTGYSGVSSMTVE